MTLCSRVVSVAAIHAASQGFKSYVKDIPTKYNLDKVSVPRSGIEVCVYMLDFC